MIAHLLILLTNARMDGSEEFYENIFKPGNDSSSSIFTGYFLHDAQKAGAVCLDGTAPLFYMRPGSGSGAKKYYIHHQGGGWCESVADCAKRARGTLGSTKADPPTMSSAGGGYFSTDPKINPLMYNWNHVLLRYCDGGSFSGNNASSTQYGSQTLYFRGHWILNAIQRELLKNHGLDTASDIVISGCSAGGLATYFHTDEWVSLHGMFSKSPAKIVGLPDSGYFLDYEANPSNYESGMRWVFEYMNSTVGVNQGCVSSESEPWRCIFAQYSSKYLQTPTFMLNSEYDSWQLGNDLDSTDPKLVNAYGNMLTANVTKYFLASGRNSGLLDSCYHHCGGWNGPKVNGDSEATAFSKWYNGEVKQNFFWAQSKPFPCKDCCN